MRTAVSKDFATWEGGDWVTYGHERIRQKVSTFMVTLHCILFVRSKKGDNVTHSNPSESAMTLDQLDSACLQQIVAHDGIDVATKTLFDALQASKKHGPAIREIDRLCDATQPPHRDASSLLVAVVPGFLYREYPASGADGRMLIDAAGQLGCVCSRIEVPSTGRLRDNGLAILAWLKKNADRPTVLASISKGGSDIVAALQHPDAGDAFRNVVGWVDVCGIIRGSPVVDVISRQRVAMLGFRLLFKLRRWEFSSVLDLRHAGGDLERGFEPPSHLRMVHVLGFPQKSDFVHNRLRSFHSQIGSLGPNDGSILLNDVVNAPGQVYPVWGADHYMRPRHRTQPLCKGLIQYVANP